MSRTFRLRDTPPPAAVVAERMRLTREADEILKRNKPFNDDETTMNKREKTLRAMVIKAGLEEVAHSKKDSRYTVRTRAPNGKEQTFSISAGTSNDAHGEANEQAAMKRFARANPAPVAAPQTALAAGLLKAAGMPTKFVDRPAHPPTSAAVHPTAELPPKTTLPVSTPKTTTTEQPMSKPLPSPGQQNKFSRANFFRLTEWMKDFDTSKYSTVLAVADAASKALDLRVPPSTTKEAMDILEKKLISRPTKQLSDYAIIARSLTELMGALGQPVPDDLAKIAARGNA